jgi:hypothetical protein
MAKRRYSKSKKRVSSSRSTRGRRSRHTKRHTRRRGRGRRGGANNPGAPEIMWPLKPNQLLPGLPNYQRGGGDGVVNGGGSCPSGGVEQPTGGSMLYTKGLWNTKNAAGGCS